MNQLTNGVTASDWIQIGIAFVALGGVVAAFFAAFLNWGSRSLLLATKEKHSRDLMEVLDTWIKEVEQILPDDQPPSNETLPKELHSFYIEKNILFADLENHIPPEMGIIKTWNSFNNTLEELEKRKVLYYQAIKEHLERYSRLKALSYAEENVQKSGITHGCLRWLYTTILYKAKGNSISFPKVSVGVPPNELMVAGQVWAWTDTPQLFNSFMDAIVSNIENEQSGVAEYHLLLEAKKVLESQKELVQIKETLLGQIAEARAIPILTGNCKYLKRAMEPLFTARRSGSKDKESQVPTTKAENHSEPSANGLKDVGKRLSDQLKTVFIAALLIFWTSTLSSNDKVPLTRGSWLPWTIASVFLFFWIVYRRNNIRRPKLRWIFPFLAVGLLWVMYYISGISFPTSYFMVFAIILLIWTVFLLVLLLLVMSKKPFNGRPERIIRGIIIWGDNISWPLTFFVLIMSVLLGWIRLWNAGMRGWWMDPLLFLGIIIVIVIGLLPYFIEQKK